MMELVVVSDETLRKDFLRLPHHVYAGYPCRRDDLGHAAQNFLYLKDAYAQACEVVPLLALRRGKAVARAVLLDDGRLDGLRLGFFEALPEQEDAVKGILDYAEAHARRRGATRIILGLNGHLTYGVGFLRSGFAVPQCFDGAYTAPYYPEYFDGRGFREHTLTTYHVDNAKFSYPERLFRKAHKRLSYRCIDLKNLRREMEILGDLFNRTLAGTRFYAPKTIAESHEMLRAFRPLLRNENIIYALHNGREVGFVLWHPNFNELIPDNKRMNPFLFFLKCGLLRNRIAEYKINTIGVLPEFAGTGAAFGLIAEVHSRVRSRYQGGETAFVWDDNDNSRLLCEKMCRTAYRRYVVYEWNLNGRQNPVGL